MIDKETLDQLATEAAEVATTFSIWAGNLEVKDGKIEAKDAMTRYNMKWIDLCVKSVENIDPTSGKETFEEVANDLSMLISVPLNGMIKSLQEYAAGKKIELPEIKDMPNEIFEFKRFATEYISKCMKMLG